VHFLCARGKERGERTPGEDTHRRKGGKYKQRPQTGDRRPEPRDPRPQRPKIIGAENLKYDAHQEPGEVSVREQVEEKRRDARRVHHPKETNPYKNCNCPTSVGNNFSLASKFSETYSSAPRNPREELKKSPTLW